MKTLEELEKDLDWVLSRVRSQEADFRAMPVSERPKPSDGRHAEIRLYDGKVPELFIKTKSGWKRIPLEDLNG